MHKLKLIKVGDATGVVIPDEVLKRLNAINGDALYISETEAGGYRLTAHDISKDECTENIMRRYSRTLSDLAK